MNNYIQNLFDNNNTSVLQLPLVKSSCLDNASDIIYEKINFKKMSNKNNLQKDHRINGQSSLNPFKTDDKIETSKSQLFYQPLDQCWLDQSNLNTQNIMKVSIFPSSLQNMGVNSSTSSKKPQMFMPYKSSTSNSQSHFGKLDYIRFDKGFGFFKLEGVKDVNDVFFHFDDLYRAGINPVYLLELKKQNFLFSFEFNKYPKIWRKEKKNLKAFNIKIVGKI